MCGIIGCVNHFWTDPEKEAALQSMAHRGPDHLAQAEWDNVFLGHARLAIQDLSNAANQPFYTADKRFAIVYNGEIYNHADIRADLVNKGYTFTTQSDTETLLHAYVAYGKDCLTRLDGIFAFAIYDSRDKALFFARDPLGVKPFYYYYEGEQLAFASELKAFLCSGNHSLGINTDAICDHINLLWSADITTLLAPVKKLAPGHYGVATLGEDTCSLQLQPYYEISTQEEPFLEDEQEALQQLDLLLEKTVKAQLLSDVPVAFFLSGGLDSGLLLAYARKLYPGRRFTAFTINTRNAFKQEGFEDDLPFAQKVADYIGNIDLQVIDVPADIRPAIDRVVYYLDEPQADPAAFWVDTIARAAGEMGYKVLISGTGADDIFSGYRRHQVLPRLRQLEHLPPVLSRQLPRILQLLPDSPFRRRLIKVTKYSGLAFWQQAAALFFWLDPQSVKALLKNKKTDWDAYAFFKKYRKPHLNDLNQMLLWEMQGFLAQHNLNYTDKMGMANGVEIRVPYLGLPIVQFAAQLSPALKLYKGNTKHLLKKVAGSYLPEAIIYRSKTGFGAPLRSWIIKDWAPFVEEVLLINADPGFHAIFDVESIRQLLQENYDGKKDAAYSIFALLLLESWLRQFMK